MIGKILSRVYEQGVANDAKPIERSAMMLNITPSTGQFLDVLIRDSQPKRILEIGTSNGYSTIWIARAASDHGAAVTSLDKSANKTEMASANLCECGLLDRVNLLTLDAGNFLAQCESNHFDLIFLDSDRTQYVD